MKQQERLGTEEAKGTVLHAEFRILPKNAHEKRVEGIGSLLTFKVAEAPHVNELPVVTRILFLRDCEVIAEWKIKDA